MEPDLTLMTLLILNENTIYHVEYFRVWLACRGFTKVEIQPAFSHRERKPGWPRCSVSDMRPAFSHAKFNTRDVCVCDLLLVANYTCQQCFSLLLEQEAKVTPPGRHVTPKTETGFGFTGNFYSRTVSHHLAVAPHPSVAGYRPLVVLQSSIRVIFHSARRRKCHFCFTTMIIFQHIKQFSIAEHRSQAKQVFMLAEI